MSTDSNEDRRKIADAFGQDPDPLAKHAERFDQLDVDPFEVFKESIYPAKDLAESTRRGYDRVFRQWKDHMAEEGRHPACPSEVHVESFVRKEQEKGWQNDTIENKVYRINSAYEYWQEDGHFPHPVDYNPFKLVLKRTNLDTDGAKEPPHISIEELRDRIEAIKNVRDRAVIVTQLKLGVRASELSNVKLSEINLANEEVRKHYDSMATHPQVADRTNSIFIPNDREMNKSKRPRVLPLDDELRKVIRDYLLIRPDVDEPWLFLSQTSLEGMNRKGINGIWTKHFHPDYEETDEHRAVTSHYGRHRFTTYWEVEVELSRELIKYLRGDKFGNGQQRKETMDDYVHTYYEDIEEVYRDDIYRLLI